MRRRRLTDGRASGDARRRGEAADRGAQAGRRRDDRAGGDRASRRRRILAPAGQIAFSNGGLTAYRPDVVSQAQIHIAKVGADVGEANLLKFSFDPEIADKAKTDAFRARWRKATGR
jgi:hypothetical protein